MRQRLVLALSIGLLTAGTLEAASFRFDADPFAGSAALITPGRQVVGGEDFITFNVANDVFSFDALVFGVSPPVSLANDVIANIPSSGANIVVLRTFDNDGNPATPFGAGNAANLLADRITQAGPGFFIYFNQGLDLPRLVFSTDLSDATADLKILARLTNLTGQPGRDSLTGFIDANVQITVPEPSTFALWLAALASIGLRRARRHTR